MMMIIAWYWIENPCRQILATVQEGWWCDGCDIDYLLKSNIAKDDDMIIVILIIYWRKKNNIANRSKVYKAHRSKPNLANCFSEGEEQNLFSNLWSRLQTSLWGRVQVWSSLTLCVNVIAETTMNILIDVVVIFLIVVALIIFVIVIVEKVCEQ